MMTDPERTIIRLWSECGDGDAFAALLEKYAKKARGAAATMRRAQLAQPDGFELEFQRMEAENG